MLPKPTLSLGLTKIALISASATTTIFHRIDFLVTQRLRKVLTKLQCIVFDSYLSNQNVSVSVAADAATSNIGVMRTVLISFGGNRNSIHAPEMFHFIKRFFYLYIV